MPSEKEKALDLGYLKSILDYDPASGMFRWNVAMNGRIKIGQVAGTLSQDGHRKILIARRVYLAHRLAWFYVTGAWPRDQIDHRNNDPDDNRFDNLREATRLQNNANCRVRKDSGTQVKGVHWHKRTRRWYALIRMNGKSVHLGSFATVEAAKAAYDKAARRRFGEFARSA